MSVTQTTEIFQNNPEKFPEKPEKSKILENEIGSIWLPERSNQHYTSYRVLILWYVHQESGGYISPHLTKNFCPRNLNSGVRTIFTVMEPEYYRPMTLPLRTLISIVPTGWRIGIMSQGWESESTGWRENKKEIRVFWLITKMRDNKASMNEF